MKNLIVDGKRIKLQIWDTAGQERYRTLSASFFKGSSGAIVAYAIDNKKSFEEVERWLENLVEKGPKDCSKLLVGTKSDLSDDRRAIPAEEADKLAKKHNAKRIECSSLNGDNVDETFFMLAKEILDTKESNMKKSLVSSNAALEEGLQSRRLTLETARSAPTKKIENPKRQNCC
eukprot:TRINITY_DN97_c0_g1_i3.p1 TRINITY_DN97_c0_g1~~TRINITY_DN97_c0_g1_i3.p1  ORF type:complete len:175 (-),score=23.16 TRINITY_DN97_c0_g1_i3:357-881(-)